MSYNIANLDQTVHSEGVQGTVQVSDGNLGFEGSNGVIINSLGDITANAFFGYTSGGGGGGGATPSLQAVTVVGASTNRAMTISNSLTVTGNLFVTGNLVSVDTENLVVQDPVIQLANTSVSDTADTGIVFTRPTSNVVVGWRGDEDEFMVGFSTSSASGTDLSPLDDDKLNLKVYGNVEATNFVKGDATHMTNLTDASFGTFGSTTQTPVISVDASGRITGISETNINFPAETLQDLDSVLTQGKTSTKNITVGKVTVTKENGFIGDGELISNTVDSSITPGTYGSGTQIPQIVIDSDHRITSITTVPNSGGDVGSLQDVSDTGNTTSNTIQFTNTDVSLVASGNVEVQGLYIGNANLLSNIVNSDVGPATYGNATHVTQITISDTGRITGVSNVEIQERSNLDQVVNRGNVTSNTVQFTNAHTALVTDLTSNVGIKIDQLSSVNITSLEAEQGLLYDGTDWVNDYNVRNFTKIINKTGDTLYQGNTVYIVDGHNANVANVALADATDSSKMPSIGLVFADIADQGEGVAVTYGKVQNVDTDNFVEGETIYVSNTQVGGFSNIKPTTNGELIQNVGIVVKSDPAQGVVFVTGVGRTNDIPNGTVTTDRADMLYIYGETAASRFAKITPDNFRSNLDQVVNRGNVTSNTVQFTNPDVSLVATGNIQANYFLGNANLLSNTVNSDVGVATYGNSHYVAQITVDSLHRISAISNVEIQELSNLDQVVNRGNVTANTVQFINNQTSLKTSGNVHINGAGSYASLNVNNPTTSNVIYVQSQTTSNSLISFVNTQTFVESGNEYPSLGCSGNDLVFYPGVPRDLAVTISADKNMTVVGNVDVQGLYLGNANLLSNTVNSDVGVATYGNANFVTQITIGEDHRITRISNVEIEERSNLDQVVNRGNVTSNTLILTDVSISGNIIGVNGTRIYTNEADPISIGNTLAMNSQGQYGIAIGTQAGETNQTSFGIAIGHQAGQTNQVGGTLAIGNNAGNSGQKLRSISLGYYAGNIDQDENSIAIGSNAGKTDQQKSAIAIGQTAGQNTQGFNGVAIGNNAAISNQGAFSIAIGRDSGKTTQGNGAVAIGRASGETSQGFRTTAIGFQAGQSTQSDYSIAIGARAGETNQHANTIVINAQEDVALNTTNVSATYIKPIRIVTDVSSNILGYTDEGEIVDRGVIHSNLEEVTNRGNVTSNTVQFTNPDVSLVATGNIQANYFLGNANLLSNTVNSDVTPGTYGDATNVAQIIIDSNHRISSISEVAISGGGGGGGSSNLDQVVNIGNVTANTIIVGGIVTEGTANLANIVVTQSSGAVTFTSGTLTVDFDNKSYKTFEVTSPDSTLSSIVVNNALDGSQGIVHLYPRGTSDIDIYPNFGSSTVKSPLYSNATINSLSDCFITFATVGSNTFVSFSEYT